MSPQDSLLSRIKKLLNMTVERGATPEEAANAAAKVQAILVEHNLTMAQAESYASPDEKREMVGRQDYQVKLKNQPKWKRALWYVVTSHNFCKMLHSGGRGYENHIYLFGKPSNIEVAIYMAEYLTREVGAMGRKAQRDHYQSNDFCTAFCYGAVSTIDARLKASMKEQEVKSSSCTALVVQSKAELDKAVAEHFPVVKTGSPRKATRSDAFAMGREAAHSISLTKGIGSSAATTKRIA